MKQRILVLDDEASILELLKQHLEEEGYECESFTSAPSALVELKSNRYDLIITDLKMPEIHGIEVVVRAKELDPEVAVIVVTALMEVTNAIEAMRAGADDYLLKPFNLSEISLAVEKALDRRRLLIENRAYKRELESRVKEATADLERTNRELRSTQEYLESLLHSTVDAILTIDAQARISFANEGTVHMFGYSRDALHDMTFAQLLHGGPDEIAYINRMLRHDKPLQNYETEISHRSGALVPVNMSLSQVHSPDRDSLSTLAICKDITQQKRLENELKEMSIKDSLTCLYNQRYFYDRLDAEIERATRQGHPLSLLLFDIDKFKPYNDCHGHLEGDKVLRTAGEVVLECTREHVDIGFRYGGDEFTVILPEADERQGYVIAERIRQSFESKRFDRLTLSIGLMEYKQGSTLRSFIRFADAMMYDAKRSGGNRVFVYRPEETVESEAAAAE
ncbi:MAG: diguanylate cyclase [Candidatus Hydrogenedentes bacterium]|nr:diguanylate cyclase [Candidatus Hydrogenedentota bacterium]